MSRPSRILHLSDLHFGRDRPELAAPLLGLIDRLAPDLVVISGDFTQRARVGQFARARDFLDRIGAPWLAVPGNHDTPLDNLWLRLVRPWARYRTAIGPDLEPQYRDDRMAVVGVNTVNRFAWQRGRISARTVERACGAFADAGARLRVLVLHHPLEHGPEIRKRLMSGARPALDALDACGADLVLSGHLHTGHLAPFAAAPGLLFVQAGTGLSTRLRGGVPNTFNLIEAGRQRIEITPFAADGRATGLAPLAPRAFVREDGVLALSASKTVGRPGQRGGSEGPAPRAPRDICEQKKKEAGQRYPPGTTGR